MESRSKCICVAEGKDGTTEHSGIVEVITWRDKCYGGEFTAPICLNHRRLYPGWRRPRKRIAKNRSQH